MPCLQNCYHGVLCARSECGFWCGAELRLVDGRTVETRRALLPCARFKRNFVPKNFHFDFVSPLIGYRVNMKLAWSVLCGMPT